MFTSAELIEALRRRARRSLRPEAPVGEYPPGWQAWFAAMRERVGTIVGAPAEAIVALLAMRALRPPPPRLPRLNPPQAFAALWRQEWFPAPRDERGQRIAAFVVSLFAQIVFAILVLWLAYARYGGEAPVQPGDEVVQVEFIGEGTPPEQGGGAPAGPAQMPQATESARPAAQPARAASARRAQAAPAPSVATASEQPAPRGAAPSPPAPAAQPQPQPQPVEVTEAAVPDAPFTLPPTSERAVVLPSAQVRVPQLAQAPEALRAVETPSPQVRALAPKLPGAEVRVPALGTSVQALPSPVPPLQGVAQRQVELAAAKIEMPALGTAPEALPTPGPPLPAIGERTVSLPQAEVRVPGLEAQPQSLPADPGGAGVARAASSEGGEAELAGGGQQAAAGGADTPAPGAGAGPKPGERAGAWNTTRPGDDWGLSDRNRPGGQSGASGIFGEDGRPRLPPGSSASSRGELPPGVVEEDIADLDRAGTWLKRKNPLPYEATTFDKYWMPGGNLLQEWVRRGIREVRIRIPGTSKRIHCVVSLLQLGGGCGIDDPDMQDQEAVAREAPDVPYKPELQDK